MTTTKRYTVYVDVLYNFWDHVEVEASSQAEAEELAREHYQLDWNRAEPDVLHTTVLTEDDQPVEWSMEAYHLDPDNPYCKVTTEQPPDEATAAPSDADPR